MRKKNGDVKCNAFLYIIDCSGQLDKTMKLLWFESTFKTVTYM